MVYLCFDIGGTFIKYGVFNEKAEPLAEIQKVATLLDKHTNHILDQVLEITASVMCAYQLKGVAISTAGVVNTADGSIRFSGPTIPGYTGTAIQASVESLAKVPCVVLNDVNAACLGEYWKGLPNDVNSMVCLTIGTGVGGAVLVNGKLVTGYTDMAGEIGYLPIDGQALQEVASTTAMLNRASKIYGQSLTGEVFFELIQAQQHPELLAVLEESVTCLAKGILSIIYLLNPEVIVIGGGILAQKAVILPLLDKALRQLVIDERFLSAEIKAASLGNDAGMIGALYQLIH